MTPTDRIERAARAMAEYDGEDVNCWRGYADDVALILTAAYPELMAEPPHWIAPNEITIGMFQEFAPWVKDASPEVQEVFARWIHGSLPEDWRRLRDAYLKEQANGQGIGCCRRLVGAV